MVSTTLPKKQTGVYLGVLNMMIVIPMLAETLTFGWIFKNLLGGSGSTAILLSGILLGSAGLSITARDDDSCGTDFGEKEASGGDEAGQPAEVAGPVGRRHEGQPLPFLPWPPCCIWTPQLT